MFGGILPLVLLLPLVASVPPSKAPPRFCRRCCDHLGPPESPSTHAATPQQMPEVRTFINMTILKGTSAVR